MITEIGTVEILNDVVYVHTSYGPFIVEPTEKLEDGQKIKVRFDPIVRFEPRNQYATILQTKDLE